MIVRNNLMLESRVFTNTIMIMLLDNRQVFIDVFKLKCVIIIRVTRLWRVQVTLVLKTLSSSGFSHSKRRISKNYIVKTLCNYENINKLFYQTK